jgi:hypothetical protein
MSTPLAAEIVGDRPKYQTAACGEIRHSRNGGAAALFTTGSSRRSYRCDRSFGFANVAERVQPSQQPAILT